MEIVLSKLEPPPQWDPLPRRLPAVDTGSEEPRTLQRSPTIGKGSDEPGVSRAQSAERKCFFPLQANFDGVDDNDEATTSQQATACEEFARPKTAAAKDDSMDYRAKQAISSRRSTVKSLLFCREECLVAYTVCSFFLCLFAFSCIFFVISAIFRSGYER